MTINAWFDTLTMSVCRRERAARPEPVEGRAGRVTGPLVVAMAIVAPAAAHDLERAEPAKTLLIGAREL